MILSYELKERYDKNLKFYLDNKLGMKEVVDGLYLVDLVFKDRDKFRILFSGYNFFLSSIFYRIFKYGKFKWNWWSELNIKLHVLEWMAEAKVILASVVWIEHILWPKYNKIFWIVSLSWIILKMRKFLRLIKWSYNLFSLTEHPKSNRNNKSD